MAYTYILKCSDGSYYTGSTKDIDKRLWQHRNREGSNHTKIRLPVTLVYVEQYDRVEEAYGREKQIQKWSRKKKEALISGDIDALCLLSKSKTSVPDLVKNSVPKLVKNSVLKLVENSVPELVEGLK